MIRGVNKYIIEVTNTENKYFDKAILFLNPDYSHASRAKIESEAKKYVLSVSGKKTSKGFLRKRQNRRKLLLTIVGLILTTLIALTIVFLVK